VCYAIGMSGLVYFITHPEVRVEPARPVPEWSLSERGLLRMRAALALPWTRTLSAIYASEEQKAVEGAEVLAAPLQLEVQRRVALGEVDRSSTGYLPHAEHEATADQLFGHPDVSARGWETARAAQARIVRAVTELLAADSSNGAVAIVSHGAVGAFLLCHLTPLPIAREHDQPGSGGGNYFVFDRALQLVHGWLRLA
jgi:broad specificity phosphatase PhoE